MFNGVAKVLEGAFLGAEIENGVFKSNILPKDVNNRRTKIVFKHNDVEGYNQMMNEINAFLEASENTIKKSFNPPHEYKTEKWMKQLIENYNKTLEEGQQPLKFYTLTAKEKEERRKLVKIAQDSFAKRRSLSALSDCVLTANKEQIKKNISWNDKEGNLDFGRAGGVMLSLFTQTPEDVLGNLRIISEGTKEERQRFFNSRLRATLDFVKEYLTAKDTSQYIYKMNEVMPLCIMAGELDGEKITHLSKAFGVDYPADLKDEISKLGVVASSVCSTQFIGNAMNPYYSIVSEKNCASLKEAFMNISNIPGYENEMNPYEDPCGTYEEFKAGTAGLLNPLAQYMVNYADMITAGPGWVRDEIKYYLSIKPELIFKGEEGNEFSITDDASLDDFVDQLTQGKKFMSFYKDGTMNAYVSFDKEANQHINLFDYQNGLDFRAPQAAVKALDEKMYDLDHWYNWNNSQEFKDVLTAVQNLKHQLEKNPGSIANHLSSAKKAAEAYLKSKYPVTNNKEKNERTYARERFCAELIHSADEFLKIKPRFLEPVKKPLTEQEALKTIIEYNQKTGYVNNKAAEEFAKETIGKAQVNQIEVPLDNEKNEEKIEIKDEVLENKTEEIILNIK